MPEQTAEVRKLTELRDVANGVITSIISDVAVYQNNAEKTTKFSSELGDQVNDVFIKRTQAMLNHLNKIIERFNTAALGALDATSNKEQDHGS